MNIADLDEHPIRAWYKYFSIGVGIANNRYMPLNTVITPTDVRDMTRGRWGYRAHDVSSVDMGIVGVSAVGLWRDELVLALERIYPRYYGRDPLLLVTADGSFMVARSYMRWKEENALAHWSFLGREYVVQRKAGWYYSPPGADGRGYPLRGGKTDVPYVELEDVSGIWMRLVPGSDSPHSHEHDTTWMFGVAKDMPHTAVADDLAATAEIERSYNKARARRRRRLGLPKNPRPVKVRTANGAVTDDDAVAHIANRLAIVTEPTSRAKIRANVTRLKEAQHS